jgi:hypothetical protein
VRWLRRFFPLQMPVTVRVVSSQPDLHGSAHYGTGRGLIRLSPDSDTVMIESLVEEWSHLARSECPIPIEDDHDGLFWAIYAHISLKMRGEK